MVIVTAILHIIIKVLGVVRARMVVVKKNETPIPVRLGNHYSPTPQTRKVNASHKKGMSISGLVVEYIVAIDVTRVRFPADALFECHIFVLRRFTINKAMLSASETQSLGRARDNDHDHISLA